ncbi:MAG: xanthine phosphoribosyltransferase [Acidobacteriota bacterium]|nr:xanthine phosphoribosyltransferase [Acidobacteriota bacterium]
MKQIEEKILREGVILPGDILKVGSFLNQNIDTGLLSTMGAEIARLFDGYGVTKILTIEASGIAIAAAAGMSMGVPVLFAKKHKTSNVDGSVYSTVVHSFTHNEDYHVVISRDYLRDDDKALLVDDFLASGRALRGLMDLCDQAGATVAGIAIAIEKCFTGAGDELRAQGVKLESLAMIESMAEGRITFRP